MNTTSTSTLRTAPAASSKRALVLGGGGSTGNAWLIGVLAGLAGAGPDMTRADRVIGTSAGSTAAAQIAGASLAELYGAVLDTPLPRRPCPLGTQASARPVPSHLERTGRIIAASTDAADMRRRMGAAALDLAADYDGSERWRATVAARLPRQEWAEHELLITAVDAGSGEAAVFNRYSGIGLVDAVAASCSSASAYRIGDKSYIDGGYRCNENADLAAGCGRVLVLSPFGGRTRMPLEWGMQLAVQVEELRAGGSRVEVIFPESEDEHMFGANAMDLSLRPAAAEAGYNQGKARAGQLAEFWR
ncbi:NTE family protein [Pseudarthrobacter defluvii]|uniref:patatin-like phospholipase family protein n=1 Tax=Pseudarthrobacter defluvii TaxID=410837 RepID=UPI00277F82EB|nr:patatin-like phospholipase family protein [Pseudarthrobacter defluvii]MDQ0767582.1 NTE family protein [Pseudarthrobacter defluvii]